MRSIGSFVLHLLCSQACQQQKISTVGLGFRSAWHES